MVFFFSATFHLVKSFVFVGSELQELGEKTCVRCTWAVMTAQRGKL